MSELIRKCNNHKDLRRMLYTDTSVDNTDLIIFLIVSLIHCVWKYLSQNLGNTVHSVPDTGKLYLRKIIKFK